MRAVALALMLVLPDAAGAGWRPLVSETVAPRGGVLMLPVGTQDLEPDDQAVVRLSDGRTAAGQIIWIHRGQVPGESWSAEATPLVLSHEFTTGVGAVPWLLAELPIDGEGPLRIDGHECAAQWWDVPAKSTDPFLERGPDAPSLNLDFALDLPEVGSPFAAWRWDQLAQQQLQLTPSRAWDDDAQRMVADHFTALWRIGLGRIESASLGVARACRDALTQRVTDGTTRLAAWVTDPQALSDLLTMLLDPDLSGEALVNAALAWCDLRPAVLSWVERSSEAEIEIALLNRTSRERAVAAHWEGTATEPHEVTAPPLVITRVRVPRAGRLHASPVNSSAPPAEPARDEPLVIVCGHDRVRHLAPTGRIMATPPGVFLAPLRPALTLAAVEGCALPFPARSGAHVRFRAERWEVFIECRRSPGTSRSESIILRIGDSSATSAELLIPEEGWHSIQQGTNDGTLQIHRRSLASVWYCRVVLPDAWVFGGDDQRSFTLAVEHHGADGSRTLAPLALPAWIAPRSGAVIDVGAWRGY